MSPHSIHTEIAELGPWFHNLHLAGGVQTNPDHWLGDFPAFKWQQLSASIPQDLAGWRVLDIGCNAGFYSFEMARRGASVLAIDLDLHYLRQARWAAHQLELTKQVEFRQMQVYQLARSDEQFDLVLFMGVFYHLRYPLLALDIVASKVKQLLVFQTLSLPGEEVYEPNPDLALDDRQPMLKAGWPKMAFVEHRIAHDPTNWWVPNHAGILAMLRSSGLRVTAQPGHEIYLCEPNPEHRSVTQALDHEQLLAATGQ